jgi:hypothetical protein
MVHEALGHAFHFTSQGERDQRGERQRRAYRQNHTAAESATSAGGRRSHPRGSTNSEQQHPFALLVEVHPIGGNSYRWVILRDELPHRVADASYATREDAAAAGTDMLRRYVDEWRTAI